MAARPASRAFRAPAALVRLMCSQKDPLALGSAMCLRRARVGLSARVSSQVSACCRDFAAPRYRELILEANTKLPPPAAPKWAPRRLAAGPDFGHS